MRPKRVVVCLLLLTLWLVGSASAAVNASIYKYKSLANLTDFIMDMAELLPNLIPLIVVAGIIVIVYHFRDYVKGIMHI